jgi:hypothetical protein
VGRPCGFYCGLWTGWCCSVGWRADLVPLLGRHALAGGPVAFVITPASGPPPVAPFILLTGTISGPCDKYNKGVPNG